MSLFRRLLTTGALIATVAPLAAQPPAPAPLGGSDAVIRRVGEFYVLDGLPEAMPPGPKGPASPWCYYYGDVCYPLPLEQGFVSVIAPDGAGPAEVERYLRRLGERSFALMFETPEEIFLRDGSVKRVPMYLYRRERARRPIEEIIAAGSADDENDWIWGPTFCVTRGYLTITRPLHAAKLNPGYGQADLETAVAEEDAGFVPGPWFSLPETYWVQNESRLGFDALLAAQRLHLRPETEWVDILPLTLLPPPGEPLPDPPICPHLGPVVAPMVPALSPGGFAVLAIVLAVVATRLSRRRGGEARS